MLDLPSNRRLGFTKNELRFVVKNQKLLQKDVFLQILKQETIQVSYVQSFSRQLNIIFQEKPKLKLIRIQTSMCQKGNSVVKFSNQKNTCQIQQKKTYNDRNQEFMSSLYGSDIKDTNNMLNEDVQIFKQKGGVQLEENVELKIFCPVNFWINSIISLRELIAQYELCLSISNPKIYLLI
ncbi:unnamed protein product [Paramecium primaurelia]|uniref:Uncharacterized protein n=1 Tax=Paramecium primaurelia TaxID=5886 RepID=A0A8S1QHJ9_PARPR|nr:unnamed protein product [Paramecium primaurelia]